MSHPKTPWTSSGGLTSDRLPPLERQRMTPPTSKKKGNQKEPEIPKSKDVRKLEKLLSALRKSSGDARDPKDGCFCQARVHALSPYVPICRRCGLVLCTLNEPYYACPHCSSPLGTETTRVALISRIEDQLSEQLAREAEDREKAVLAARRAAGAFPLLGQATPPSSGPTLVRSYAAKFPPQPQPPTSQSHKVLSLNSKTKKVVMTTFSNPPSRPDSRAEQGDLEDGEELGRVARPPSNEEMTKKDSSLPWKGRLNGIEVVYVPLVIPEDQGKPERNSKNRRKPKDKGKKKAA